MSYRRRLLLFGLLILLAAVGIVNPVQAQEVNFPHVQFDAASEEARKEFGGELFLYYFRPDSDAEETVEAGLLGDNSLAAYINAHFARYAVNILSDESKVLQQTYGLMEGETNPTLQPAIAVISLDKHDVHLKYWEQEEDVDPSAFRAWLEEIKERE